MTFSSPSHRPARTLMMSGPEAPEEAAWLMTWRGGRCGPAFPATAGPLRPQQAPRPAGGRSARRLPAAAAGVHVGRGSAGRGYRGGRRLPGVRAGGPASGHGTGRPERPVRRAASRDAEPRRAVPRGHLGRLGCGRRGAGGRLMSAANVTVRPRARDWSRVAVGSPDLAAADRDALGTTARIVTWPAENLPGMLAAVDAELALLDSQASRFREDSELSALHAAGGGTHRISDGLAEAVGIALAAAAWTGGLADPTVGGALIALGYDRDFALIGGAMRDGQALARAGLGGAPHGGGAPHDGGPPGGGACPAVAVPGWRSVRLAGNLLTLPPGVRLDLGATAKGLGADRCA